MEANWIIIGIVLIAVVLLVGFLIRKNQKDEKEYEEFLKNEDNNYGEKPDEDEM